MFDTLLEGIRDLEAGPDLADLLARVDERRVGPDELVVVVEAHQRMLSYHQARLHRAIAGVVDHYTGLFDGDIHHGLEGASLEIGSALHLTRRAASGLVEEAANLFERLPSVAGSLERGDLDRPRVRTILFGTEHLPADEARRIADRILPEAPNLTTGQIAARLRRLCASADPTSAKKRYDHAVDRRCLMTRQSPDGTVHLLGFDLPADRAVAISDTIDRVARSLRSADKDRSMDQLRADVYLDLLEGGPLGANARPRGGVELTIPLETLARLSAEPGEIGGIGPIVADIARQIAADTADAPWTYRVTDASGEPTHVGTTRRRPTAEIERRVRARDRRCVFPGCRMPAQRCDLDHRTPWSHGGSTCSANLAPLCRFHHTGRHRHGWSYRPDGDTYVWRSPLGHRYTAGARSP